VYDFYFGSKDKIKSDEKAFLLGIKRNLPRWCNGIPDSEFLAIADILDGMELEGRNPVFLETGTGASTLVLIHYALKYDGMLFSWDFNGSKGAFLRGVITDTLLNYHRKNIFNHWTFVAYNSTSEHLGISILKEMGKQVCFCFFDSDHTLDVLIREVELSNEVLVDGGVIAIDDANYTYRHLNYAYLNMFRTKLGLSTFKNTPDNTCEPFYIEVERFLKERWNRVEYLNDSYKRNYKTDIFWNYYGLDREVLSSIEESMEKTADLEHRFDAWKVWQRRETMGEIY